MTEENAQQDEAVGTVTITITENSVKYDTQLPLPDLVFWLETVKNMAIDSVMQQVEE